MQPVKPGLFVWGGVDAAAHYGNIFFHQPQSECRNKDNGNYLSFKFKMQGNCSSREDARSRDGCISVGALIEIENYYFSSRTFHFHFFLQQNRVVRLGALCSDSVQCCTSIFIHLIYVPGDADELTTFKIILLSAAVFFYWENQLLFI